MTDSHHDDLQNDIKNDFPILNQAINGYPLIYLDNAATTQKPKYVIDAMSQYYQTHNANVHRGIHYLTEVSTTLFEEARSSIKEYIHAKNEKECIFTKGTTDSINLVAYCFAEQFLKQDDEIIISASEHHSNIVPWQIACQKKGAKLKIIPFDDKGQLILDVYEKLLNEKTRIVAVSHVSNLFGTIHPIQKIVELAHQYDIPVLVDGAQAAGHLKIDVQQFDCDFYAFSAHKMYGPTGIGILYAKEKWLEKFTPYQSGGEMIKRVRFDKTVYNDLPYKFEAGTPAICEAIGLHHAINYINRISLDYIEQHETSLLQYTLNKLPHIPNISIIGNAILRAPIVSFTIKSIHPHDIGTVLNQNGIAIRTGHMCAQPALHELKLNSVARLSFGLYNTCAQIDKLMESLENVKKFFDYDDE